MTIDIGRTVDEVLASAQAVRAYRSQPRADDFVATMERGVSEGSQPMSAADEAMLRTPL